VAATNFTPIQLYRTSTPSAVPNAANLLAGELAINLADVALFAENSAGTVTRIMNNPAGLVYPTADGTAGQVISTNGSGVLSFAAASTGTVSSVALSGGTTGLTVSGSPITTSGTITLAGTLAVANGGTGAATLTANNVLLGNGTSALQAVAPGTTGNVLTSDGTTWTSAAAPSGAVQYPQNSQSADYTLVLGDAGKQIFHPVGDNNARTFTIPANSSVAFPVGTVIKFINMAAAFVRIAITTDTLTLSPGGTSGTLVLDSNGSATCIKITSTQWLISGDALGPAVSSVEYLVVAGGGGGGYAGGGAGGFRTGTLTPIVSGTTYTVTVGGGGAGGRNSGSNSVFATITSTGGGGGGRYLVSERDGLSGGSGGGGGASGADAGVGGAGTAGQGFAGGGGAAAYKGGGGGGAGGGGGTATGGGGGNGGAGASSSLSGSSVFYGGGGGGYNNGLGGTGGGGLGNGTAGTANRGGGGGGRSGAGGSGIVIIRYPNTFPNAVVTGSPTLTNTGGFKIYTFNASGTITW
jgi:hypothetical protein